ncbi:hypothetical protein D9619_013503 [Psilocybe cf. subviscida]|uniref:Uncharacterized protein n=1 Tax=Psilocybe cf. subviscida TaxID=2480587 RepID=A0A8H5F4E4_9AGAR|nr:hypothetical protein D9619_013503 [Psilocybe cf. subviscida]
MSGQEQINSSRAEQRKQRLLEAEREVAREEAEALKLTEEQRLALLRPFTSVKAEFTDLDGLRWTQTALRYHQPPNQQRPGHVSGSGPPGAHFFSSAAPTSASPDSKTFVVLTNSDLTSFSGEDTVRPSARGSRPAFSPLLSLSLYSPKNTKGLKRSSARQVISVDDLRGHRNGTRTRSPVKGLFLGTANEDSIAASPFKTAPPPPTILGRPTTAALAMNELAVSLSEEGDIGAGPPGLSRAPTYSVAPPLSFPTPLTLGSTSMPPPSISIIATETASVSDRHPDGPELHPHALYDTRNPAAYGYSHRDATPSNNHSPVEISTYRAVSRSMPSLVSAPSSSPTVVPMPAPASAPAPPEFLGVPRIQTQTYHSPRTRLQSLLHDNRPSSESTVRGFDFPLPPQSPPGLVPTPAAGREMPIPGTIRGPSREPGAFPPGAHLPEGANDIQQDDDTQAQGQSLTLTPLDLSYRYAYGMAYDSESEDDMTPTPSPTFSPGELHLGRGDSRLTSAALAPPGGPWHRPWMVPS